MTVEHYAQAGVALAFQSTVIMLTDIGFSSSILALSGRQATDPYVIGRYVRSARHLRSFLLLLASSIFICVFPWITAEHAWGFMTKCSILVSILFAVFFQGLTIYQAPLLANRKIGLLYMPQVLSSVLRLTLSACMQMTHLLTGTMASWIGTFALTLSNVLTKLFSKHYVKEPSAPDAETNKEMLRYLSPLIPGIVFTAFQSQIQIVLITLMGTTQSIAEVAALGRLGQLFTILAAFNGVIIGPYFAALPYDSLHRRYLTILSISALLAAGLSLVSFLYPQLLLWLLGPKYQALGKEVGWVVSSASLGYLGGVAWTMHAARKWIFWWSTIVYIATMLITQAFCILLMDLSHTHSVVVFGLIATLVSLLIQLSVGAYGLSLNRQVVR